MYQQAQADWAFCDNNRWYDVSIGKSYQKGTKMAIICRGSAIGLIGIFEGFEGRMRVDQLVKKPKQLALIYHGTLLGEGFAAEGDEGIR